jgi:hypothetical protein
MDLDELITNADPARGLEINVPEPGLDRPRDHHWVERIAVAVLLAVVVAVGVVGLSIGSNRSRSAASGRLRRHFHTLVLGRPGSACVSAQLRLQTRDAEGETGEHAEMFVLRNISRQSCTLDGYPAVTFKAQALVLPFVYRDGGGYVRTGAPTMVVLRPSHQAYVLVAKYRCDGQDEHGANRIVMTAAGGSGRLTLALALDQFGVGQYEYCKRYPGDARIDPGNYVDVSPVEPTAEATLPYAETHPEISQPLPRLSHICRRAQLSIRMVRSGAGLGTASGVIAFTNTSSATCQLRGWPTLLSITAAHRVSRAKAVAGSEVVGSAITGTPTVSIRPGRAAYAIFLGADGPATFVEPDGKQRTTPCRSPFHILKITPPGDYQSVSVSAWIPYLGKYLPACGTIIVSPVMTASSASVFLH